VTGLERIAAEVLAALFLIWGTVLYLEHRGAQQCYSAEAKTVATAEIHNTEVEQGGMKADVKAETKYDFTIALPVATVPALPSSVSAPACPSAVPKAGGPAPAGDYRPTIRAPTATGVVSEGWNTFERSDVQSARDADAEVIYLQTLLKTQHAVCTGQIIH